MKIAVTGCAGFVGAKVVRQLLERGHTVWGIDNYDPMYAVALKRRRVQVLDADPEFTFSEGDIRSQSDVAAVIDAETDVVIHLAAQGGLRQSMDKPGDFISSNVGGFGVVVKQATDVGVARLVYASSGAVYGGTAQVPFRENDAAAWPLSLYGATKRADELIAFTYSHVTGIRTTGLRFSTVYGTDGRPDMATYQFARRIHAGEPIQVHGQGKMVRDFVFGDDVAKAVVLAAEDTSEFGPTHLGAGVGEQAAAAPWRVLNVATGRQVELMELIRLVEKAVGREAKLNLQDALAAEVIENRMDVTEIGRALGFTPEVQVEAGIPLAVEWCLANLDILG